ncbi:MAG: hypothetical protein LRY73_03775 [Bacillus sp. (in: Bacteria)]|nr:hypothetical protein [Bacillus sp. (in: firmicutes)]
MADSIFNRYKGENGIREEEVDEHILFNTSFPPDKFLKKTLRWMEEKGLLANVKKKKWEK